MPTISADTDLLSLGKLCELLQASPNRIERAIERAGIRPALRLNGIAYYTDSVANRLRILLRPHLAKGAKT